MWWQPPRGRTRNAAGCELREEPLVLVLSFEHLLRALIRRKVDGREGHVHKQLRPRHTQVLRRLGHTQRKHVRIAGARLGLCDRAGCAAPTVILYDL